MNLRGEESEYRIRTNTGIGGVTLNSRKVSDRETHGDGPNVINVNGGVGTVEIRTD